jgi:hypothetical protein
VEGICQPAPSSLLENSRSSGEIDDRRLQLRIRLGDKAYAEIPSA